MTNDQTQAFHGLQRNNAITVLATRLQGTQEQRVDIPKLSEEARTALATMIVDKNGLDGDRNYSQAIAEIRTNRKRWEYYGIVGKCRLVLKWITG
jgi:hypothetical protein